MADTLLVTQLDRMETRLEKSMELLIDYNSQITSILTKCEGCRGDVEKICKIVIGNGTIGLVGRVDNLETININKAKQEERNLWKIGLVVGMIATVLSTIVPELLRMLFGAASASQ